MTDIRHSSSPYYARNNIMVEKKTVNFVRLPQILVTVLFVILIAVSAGRVEAQSSPNGPVFQSMKMEYLGAESAKRTLMQQLPQEMAESLLVKVNPETNEIQLVGYKNAVLLAVQTLQDIDNPNASPSYHNTTNPPSSSQNAPRQNTLQPLSRDDFGTPQSYSAAGDGFQRNAGPNPQNTAANTAATSNLSFREPTPGANFNTSFSTANSPAANFNSSFTSSNSPADTATVEGYEPGTYFCKPSHLNRMYQELQARYGLDRNIVLEMIPDSGKILVWAPQRIQREITALMTQAGAWAEVPPGRDPREFEGTLLRFASEPKPQATMRQPMTEQTHSPKFVTLEQIEARLQGLFGNRIAAMSEPGVQPKRYRIAIPQRPQGMIVCEVLLDYPNYQITIVAPQNIAVEMMRLVQAIDQESPGNGRDRRFISIQNADVDQIRKLLDVYRSKPAPDSSRRFRNNPNMLAYQRNGNTTRNPYQQVNYQDEGGLGAGFGSSFGQGQVTGDELGGGIILDPGSQLKIQVIPELEIVVIDAPMEEVRRIMDMIKEIEELSKLAQSEIEIMHLKHVNCEALDALLRTELRKSTVYPYDPVYLYMEMFATKQGRVWVLPLQNPNAMLIVGWGQAREAMKKFIEQLDRPVDAENGQSLLRVIKLEYASADEVATVLTDFFEPPVPGMVPGIPPQLQPPLPPPPGFNPRIRVLSDPRTNSLIIQAAPNDYRDIERIIAELDTGKGGLKLQVQAFKMKNMLASDMKTALDSALIMAKSGTTDKRIPVIELILGEGQGRKIIESGFLTEVTIEAIDGNNTVIVTGPGNCMPLFKELIDMLDQSPGVAMVKVIPIKYSDAGTIRMTLNTIFPTQQPGTPNTISLPNAEGGEIFIPLRIGTDTRSNSILVAGAQSEIMFIETLIAKLDQKDALQQETKIHQLRNSSATDVETAIRKYLTDRTDLQTKAEVSAYQKLQDAVLVQAEPISNTLIISASKSNMEEIENLIKQLDKEPPQVTIQVLIAEVALGKADEFGIELGLQDPYLFSRSSVATGELRPGYNFADPSVGLGNSDSPASLATSGTVATQLLSNFGTGRINSDTGFGGMVFSASSDAVSVLIRAMQERSHSEVLSRPQITTQDNQLAIIFVGQNVFRSQGTDATQYGVLSSKGGNEDVGLFLGVVPRISPGTKDNESDRITMLISVSKSNLGSANEGQQMVVNNQIVRAPNVNKTRTETIVSALDGETVLLGGYITTDKQDVSRRVPFLSSIPIAGNLFKYEYEKQKRSELIIIMRPRIVRRSEDMEAIKRVEFARMNWCLADVTRLHGDIGYYSTMSRQPVTGGAPSFAPDPVDMSQLRDMPTPQTIYSRPTDMPGGMNVISPMPSTMQSTPMQSAPMPFSPGVNQIPSPQLPPTIPGYSTMPPDGPTR